MRYLYVKYGDNDYGYSAKQALQDLFLYAAEGSVQRILVKYYNSTTEMIEQALLKDGAVISKQAHRILEKLHVDEKLSTLFVNLTNLHQERWRIQKIIDLAESTFEFHPSYSFNEMRDKLSSFNEYFKVEFEFHWNLDFLEDAWGNGETLVLDMHTGKIWWPN